MVNPLKLKKCSKDYVDLNKILQMKNDPSIYNNLSKAISPSVFGHDEVKKGLLLMLFGGVNKETQEGIKLRGDINILLLRDHSTAKSQFNVIIALLGLHSIISISQIFPSYFTCIVSFSVRQK